VIQRQQALQLKAGTTSRGPAVVVPADRTPIVAAALEKKPRECDAMIRELWAGRVRSPGEIARQLNDREIRSPRGKVWTKSNLIARLHVLRLIGKAKPAKVAVTPERPHLCRHCGGALSIMWHGNVSEARCPACGTAESGQGSRERLRVAVRERVRRALGYEPNGRRQREGSDPRRKGYGRRGRRSLEQHERDVNVCLVYEHVRGAAPTPRRSGRRGCRKKAGTGGGHLGATHRLHEPRSRPRGVPGGVAATWTFERLIRSPGAPPYSERNMLIPLRPSPQKARRCNSRLSGRQDN
jgi:hypothetical protein